MKTLPQIKKILYKYDRNMKQGTEQWNAALVLLSSAFIGADTKRISDFCNLQEKVVIKFEKNLRKNGIWEKEKVCHSGWDDKKNGGIAFALDIAVAVGMVERVK